VTAPPLRLGSAERVAQHVDRIRALDVLRGIALLGMFLVHFSYYSSGGGRLGDAYLKVVELFFEERFWTMFGILFGVGFAIQLRRAEARGGSFVPRYLRRLAALTVFGFIAHAVFGFNVLLAYALWGLPLLLVRTWPARTLLVALVLSAASFNIYWLARTTWAVETRGEEAWRAERIAAAARDKAFNEENRKEQDAKEYSAVFAARLRHMRWFYAQWFSFLPVNNFTLFLLGVLALRLGIFDRPEQHRRLIVALMAFGVAAWMLETWLLPRPSPELPAPLIPNLIIAQVKSGYGLIRGMWLAFAYIGAVLLLIVRDPAWLRRLAAFGWTGRMALTNYMVQIAILDLLFASYALGLSMHPLVGLASALALFGLDALFSRWWLARFRYGPLEWLWRSITYARWQPWRMAASPGPG